LRRFVSARKIPFPGGFRVSNWRLVRVLRAEQFTMSQRRVRYDWVPGTQFESSGVHHAVMCYRRFPEGVTKGLEFAGICATVRSRRPHSHSRQVVSAHFSLAPKSRFPETETARGRDSVRVPARPKEVRASGAAETTRRACRRGGPLPCHEAAAPRWPLSRDRAPGRQARSSC
jgi:hypothetical protein